MSLITYLGRSPAVVGPGDKETRRQGDKENPLSEAEPGSRSPCLPVSLSPCLPCRQMELSCPILSDAVVEEIRRHEVLGYKMLSAVFPLKGGAEALRENLHRLRSEAERAVYDGYNVLCLSHKEAFSDDLVPVPS